MSSGWLIWILYNLDVSNKVDNPSTLGLMGVSKQNLDAGEGTEQQRRQRKIFAVPPGVRTKRAAAPPTAQHPELEVFHDRSYVIRNIFIRC